MEQEERIRRHFEGRIVRSTGIAKRRGSDHVMFLLGAPETDDKTCLMVPVEDVLNALPEDTTPVAVISPAIQRKPVQRATIPVPALGRKRA